MQNTWSRGSHRLSLSLDKVDMSPSCRHYGMKQTGHSSSARYAMSHGHMQRAEAPLALYSIYGSAPDHQICVKIL